MNKRQKFVFTSILLSFGFIGINLIDNSYRFWAVLGLSLVTLILFIFSLWEGLGINATLLTLVLPTLFTLGVGLFWFLIPSSIFARIPVVILYGVGVYALSLTMNIFTVSAIRNIALVRVALAVGFILTLLDAFLLFDAILSIKANILVTSFAVGLVSLPLFLQGLWMSNLEKSFRKIRKSRIPFYACLFSLGMVEVSSLLYFWPVTVVVGSLFLTVGIYVLLGLGQAQVEGRLFKQTTTEYLSLGLIVFLAMLLATHWG